jgi:transcription antitermination factor NusG
MFASLFAWPRHRYSRLHKTERSGCFKGECESGGSDFALLSFLWTVPIPGTKAKCREGAELRPPGEKITNLREPVITETAVYTDYSLTEAASSEFAPWYAIRVMSNRERAVASLLEGRGFQVSLPLYWSRRNGTGRRKLSVLFPGYLFSSFDPNILLPILSVPGVVHIVCRQRVPVAVDPTEMNAVRRLSDASLESQPCAWIAIGERVRVREGPLAGVEGILAREGTRDRIVISVSLLMRSVMVELNRSAVESAEAVAV